MKNIVIKVLSLEHGKKVIEYYKKLGVDVNDYEGCNVGYYYGCINGKFSSYNNRFVDKDSIIELPTEPELTFPREMMVWDIIYENRCKRTVIQDLGDEILNRYIALTIEESNCIKKEFSFG